MPSARTYNVLSVVGARPQFIKLAAIAAALKNQTRLVHQVVHTGQHYDSALSAAFFAEFGLPDPDYSLSIGSASANKQLADCILALDAVFAKSVPDLVLIYGDTNTTAAAAIAAVKRNIPIAHVEAGLREFDKSIPEETNKRIADVLADIWFAPTLTAFDQLKKEGHDQHVIYTGDVVLDILWNKYPQHKKPALTGTEYLFFTCHRAANTDKPENLLAILQAIQQLPYPVYFPVHPRTRNAIDKHGLASYLQSPNLHTMEPCSFWETQKHIRNASVVITDSGGVIKEAYFHQTPCVVVDKQTEWIEAVEEGWTIVAGPDTKKIYNAVMTLKVPQTHQQRLGDGKAGQRIAQHLIAFLDGK